MKNATLIGLIGVIAFIGLNIYNFISTMKDVSNDLYTVDSSYYVGTGISFLAWCCLGYFFIRLYMKQK